jgi:ribosome-associated translation inhibitor RaiA
VKITQRNQMPQPVLTVRGEFGGGLDELVAEKLAVVARHSHHPVLAVHIGLDRHPDPAVAEPVVAKANIDLNGRHVHAEATARTVQDALGRLMDKVVRQLDDRPRRPRSRTLRISPATGGGDGAAGEVAAGPGA